MKIFMTALSNYFPKLRRDNNLIKLQIIVSSEPPLIKLRRDNNLLLERNTGSLQVELEDFPCGLLRFLETQRKIKSNCFTYHLL